MVGSLLVMDVGASESLVEHDESDSTLASVFNVETRSP